MIFNLHRDVLHSDWLLRVKDILDKNVLVNYLINQFTSMFKNICLSTKAENMRKGVFI